MPWSRTQPENPSNPILSWVGAAADPSWRWTTARNTRDKSHHKFIIHILTLTFTPTHSLELLINLTLFSCLWIVGGSRHNTTSGGRRKNYSSKGGSQQKEHVDGKLSLSFNNLTWLHPLLGTFDKTNFDFLLLIFWEFGPNFAPHPDGKQTKVALQLSFCIDTWTHHPTRLCFNRPP